MGNIHRLWTCALLFMRARASWGDPNSIPQLPLLGDGPVSPNTAKPNIVFILTDDQDLHMQSLDYMPLLKKHITDRGTFFKRHFCTVSLCCPSRVTLWTGKAAHNTNVTNVTPPYGGYPKFISQGLNDKYLPVWLQEAGYNTYYTGKLFNAHSVDNYHSPYAAGWSSSDFLLDPFTYWYMNSSYQKDRDPPVSYEGRHSVDVLAEKALGLLDAGVGAGKPFFLGVAPVAPHANIWSPAFADGGHADLEHVEFSPPVPAARHATLFEGVQVPRTPNFNPDKPSGGSWIRQLPKQDAATVAYNDAFYRQRLRALQSVDELVDGLVRRLAQHGVLDNTYIVYTTDNGYHIGQHRLQPAKQCSFEEDINIPLLIRGPGVPAGAQSELVTTHTDLAPTLLGLAGAGAPPDDDDDELDGVAIPLTAAGLADAGARNLEHVGVEHWGFASNEGEVAGAHPRLTLNNTYKALRVISSSSNGTQEPYDLHYHVWCSNERELHDLRRDPGQLRNLLLLHADEDEAAEAADPPSILGGVPLRQLTNRLDALLFVLKSCRGATCARPWAALGLPPAVTSLAGALDPRFDAFFARPELRVAFRRCEMGFLREAEGPVFEEVGVVHPRWHEWT
ncbi:alkaline-phosphatase-like protein [Xylariomycetidae sp. FL0641]|nr:alkaline-phosphatase-like protein [Xylariomycetidae sp. FL0641]